MFSILLYMLQIEMLKWNFNKSFLNFLTVINIYITYLLKLLSFTNFDEENIVYVVITTFRTHHGHLAN